VAGSTLPFQKLEIEDKDGIHHRHLQLGNHGRHLDIAEVYRGLRRPDPAMRWLNRGYLSQDKGMDMVGIDPRFDGRRGDQHFEELLRRLRLKPAA
jgi:hypothetical protein